MIGPPPVDGNVNLRRKEDSSPIGDETIATYIDGGHWLENHDIEMKSGKILLNPIIGVRNFMATTYFKTKLTANIKKVEIIEDN